LKIRENFHFHARLRLNVSDGEIYALTRFFFELGVGLKLGFSLQIPSFFIRKFMGYWKILKDKNRSKLPPLIDGKLSQFKFLT
jgi:hypothetical protein